MLDVLSMKSCPGCLRLMRTSLVSHSPILRTNLDRESASTLAQCWRLESREFLHIHSFNSRHRTKMDNSLLWRPTSTLTFNAIRILEPPRHRSVHRTSHQKSRHGNKKCCLRYSSATKHFHLIFSQESDLYRASCARHYRTYTKQSPRLNPEPRSKEKPVPKPKPKENMLGNWYHNEWYPPFHAMPFRNIQQR